VRLEAQCQVCQFPRAKGWELLWGERYIEGIVTECEACGEYSLLTVPTPSP
jgi:hypothetical protein